jgi:hypothetical protein
MPPIGKMKHKIQLVFKKIKQDKNGEFIEEDIIGNSYWARVTPINMGFKRIENDWNQIQTMTPERIYKIAMRKNYSRDALQADLVGVMFKGRVLKLLNTLQPSENNQWVEALVVDYGVTRK